MGCRHHLGLEVDAAGAVRVSDVSISLPHCVLDIVDDRGSISMVEAAELMGRTDQLVYLETRRAFDKVRAGAEMTACGADHAEEDHAVLQEYADDPLGYLRAINWLGE